MYRVKRPWKKGNPLFLTNDQDSPIADAKTTLTLAPKFAATVKLLTEVAEEGTLEVGGTQSDNVQPDEQSQEPLEGERGQHV